MPRVVHISQRSLPTRFVALVQLHPPRPIHDRVAYENAQEMIDALTRIPKPSQGQREYLETLSILFEAYENENFDFDPADMTPVQALQHLIQENDMTASDLGRLLGERSLGPKILNGGRELSKAHIRKLSEHFGVSADLFL